MRSLAKGEKGFESFPKLLKAKFVFLNIYCTSVADEHKPRGPKGPYQFNDESVPVYVIKRWNGETFSQQLGFGSGPAATKGVARALEKALKKNGPVTAPKALRPLIKQWKKAEVYFEKKRPGYGWKELNKLLTLAKDPKKFPKGLPGLGQKAKAKVAKLEAAFTKEFNAAKTTGKVDYDQGLKQLKGLMRTYGMIKSKKALIKQAIVALPKNSN